MRTFLSIEKSLVYHHQAKESNIKWKYKLKKYKNIRKTIEK